MLLKTAGMLGKKAVQSPITAKVVKGARLGAELASIVGVPFAGTAAKGLGLAEKILTAVKNP